VNRQNRLGADAEISIPLAKVPDEVPAVLIQDEALGMGGSRAAISLSG
jgi:hypothetical protein